MQQMSEWAVYTIQSISKRHNVVATFNFDNKTLNLDGNADRAIEAFTKIEEAFKEE